MKVKQIIAMIVVVALLMTGSVLVTMAYLTSEKQIVNVFTVGNIRMILDETKVDKNGNPVDMEGNPVPEGQEVRLQQGNSYHLVPGGEYKKDPRVTILENSDECYVRMMVTVNKYTQLKAAFPDFCGTIEKDGQKYENVFLLQNLVKGWNGEEWSCESISYNAAENTATYEFRFYETVETGAEQRILSPLFDTVKIPETVTKEQLEDLAGLKLDVIACAMQADGFASADAAWEAFDGVADPEPAPSVSEEPSTPTEVTVEPNI